MKIMETQYNERYNADIRVESQPGKTDFEIVLPRTDNEN